MVSRRFGEAKGPFAVWLFILSYFVLLIVFMGPLMGSLPESFPMAIALNLLVDRLRTWGVAILFLIAFVGHREKRRSVKETFYSLGVRRQGAVMSMLWALALTPLYLLINLATLIASFLLTPKPMVLSSVHTQLTPWYTYYMIVDSFFPVAVVEEMLGRGYMLDRLMPEHPSSIVKALPAILVSSTLFTVYHLPAYLKTYGFQPLMAAALLAGNVFPWSVALSIAYVRARRRNIMGPVIIHFLADSTPYILMLTTAR